MNVEPHWLATARLDLGLAEIPGKETLPQIRKWLLEVGAWWTDDETPWCGTWVGHVMKASGFGLPPHPYRARSWLLWGVRLAAPIVGCIVVFAREGGGHVGFVVGRDRHGNLVVLGGNQKNRVSIAPFDRSRVLGFRWPNSIMYSVSELPLLVTDDATSSNEA